jgi:hypothetical protein
LVFLKGILGGLISVTITWVTIICVFQLRISILKKQQGITGLVGVAGGWEMLLHTWWIVLLLTLAFGLGLYWTVWRS